MDRLPAPTPLPPLADAFLGFQPGAVRLGELLISQNICTPDDVSSALDRQSSDRRRLGELLIEAGACTPMQLRAVLRLQAVAGHAVWTELGQLRWHPECRFANVTDGAAPVTILGVPRLGDYIALSPLEYGLADLLCEHARYQDLLQAAWDRWGMLVTPEQVVQLAERLRQAGCLVGGDGQVPPRRRTWRDLAMWRIPLADPSRLLGLLAPLLRPMASLPFALGIWLPLVLAAAVVAIQGWSEIAPSLEALVHLRDPARLGWIYLALFVVMAVHEFGHAAICHALGGPVHQLGLMFYMGMPFGYCDVSAAHLLPRRRDRVAVSLGGLYYQVGLSALATLAWGLAPLPPGVRAWALDLAILGGGSILFDLNPFAKLDGYYVLSDGLGLRNLRDRSFAFLFGRLTGRPTESLTPREQVGFLIYGALGAVATLGMVLLAVHWWGQLVMQLFHG